MSLFYTAGNIALHHGNSLAILRDFAPDSIDSCVTDPPYEQGFMGKKWDRTGIANNPELWAGVFRALKPGAHVLSFGGNRTHHRMVCAMEDAGFEIRDEIDWLYGQGFPKSLNFDGEWDGWGTALKPAKEPICVARKPFVGTVEDNLIRLGVGALNIDGCRVDLANGEPLNNGLTGDYARLDTAESGWGFKRVDREAGLGRWPANIIHDGSPEVLAAFPQAAGQLGDLKNHNKPRGTGIFGDMAPAHDAIARVETNKSAARFFYCAKTSQQDREEGLDCYEIVIAQCSAWENVDQKAVLWVDTAQSPPRVIAASGAPNNDANEWNTFLFGSQSMGLSLMGSKSIIRTKTNSTTSSKILSFFQTRLTNGYTADVDGFAESVGSLAESAESSSGPMIITSDVVVSVHGVARAASQMQWKISASDACPLSSAAELVDRSPDSAGMNSPRAGAGRTAKRGRRNTHCTVKPTALMQYLVRLITPPGGTVLDPFTGSGSTGKACAITGFGFVGIELNEGYCGIARARIDRHLPAPAEIA